MFLSLTTYGACLQTRRIPRHPDLCRSYCLPLTRRRRSSMTRLSGRWRSNLRYCSRRWIHGGGSQSRGASLSVDLEGHYCCQCSTVSSENMRIRWKTVRRCWQCHSRTCDLIRSPYWVRACIAGKHARVPPAVPEVVMQHLNIRLGISRSSSLLCLHNLQITRNSEVRFLEALPCALT